MARPLFQEGPYIDSPIANQTALVATTAEALWLGATYTPIYANEPKAARIYSMRAFGILSTGASGTLILIPQYGVLGGTTMGTSITATVPINLTNVPWTLKWDMVFRTIGAAGANSTVMGAGEFISAGTAATAGSAFVLSFGGTSAAVDATINSGVTISKTLSVAGSVTVMGVYGFWRN
jgi:hypothetical protein